MRKLEKIEDFKGDMMMLSKHEMWIVNGGKTIEDASKTHCTKETCVDNCSDITSTITRDEADGSTSVEVDTYMTNDDCN